MEQRQCYDYKLSVVTFKQQFLIMKKVLLYVLLELSPSEVLKLNCWLTLSKMQMKICILIKIQLKYLN